MAGVLAEGTLYFDPLVAGVAQGREQWPGVGQVEIKPNGDLIEQISKDKGKYGQVTGSVAIPKPDDLSITIREVTGKMLAAAFHGTADTFSQGAGTVTDQVVTAKLGKFVKLGKGNINTASVVLTNSAGSTTYVENTDYRVNYAVGMIEILTAGAITDEQSLKVDFAYSAISGDRVKGAKGVTLRGELFLDGTNLMDGKPLELTIEEATLMSEGAIDFLSDKPIEVKFKGRMVTPPGKDAPYAVVMNIVHS